MGGGSCVCGVGMGKGKGKGKGKGGFAAAIPRFVPLRDLLDPARTRQALDQPMPWSLILPARLGGKEGWKDLVSSSITPTAAPIPCS